MARGDRGLQLVRPDSSLVQGFLEQPGGLVDLSSLPAAAILVLESYELALAVNSGEAP